MLWVPVEFRRIPSIPSPDNLYVAAANSASDPQLSLFVQSLELLVRRQAFLTAASKIAGALRGRTRSQHSHVSHDLQSLKGHYIGDYAGDYYRRYYRDTRSLDCSSSTFAMLCAGVLCYGLKAFSLRNRVPCRCIAFWASLSVLLHAGHLVGL